MSIIVACRCGQRFQAGDHLAGREVPCPACAEPLLIPDLASHSLVELVELESVGPTERIPVACSCGKRFKADPKLRDKIISCPNCGQSLLVGAAAPVAPMSQVSIKPQPRANSYFPAYQYPTQPVASDESFSDPPTYSYAPPYPYAPSADKDDQHSGNGTLIAVISVGFGLVAIAVVALLIVVRSRQDDRPATVSKQSVPPTTSRDNLADLSRDSAAQPFPKEDGKWKLYTSVEGRYSILMPGNPTTGQKASFGVGGTLTTKYARCDTPERVGFGVAYLDYPGVVQLQDNRSFGTRLDLVEKVFGFGEGAKLLSKQPRDVCGHWGREYEFQLPVGRQKCAAYMIVFEVRNRFYQMICVENPGRIRVDEKQKFFESFRISEFAQDSNLAVGGGIASETPRQPSSRDQPKTLPASPGSRPDPHAAKAITVFRFSAYRGNGNATEEAKQALARYAWAEIGKLVADLDKKTIVVPSRYKPDDLPSAKFDLREAGFEIVDAKYLESGQ